jgi:hypothetical protein
MNDLIQKRPATDPVECLGITFPDEDARREHFLRLLAEKLKDPAFRNQDGPVTVLCRSFDHILCSRGDEP